ncbi:MAG: TetR/AcrR family transcriptional regulator [Tannerella sp.]|jgi:AcrR family transcriptional regulator|nr:TetR/AcrR family transcriptional regulator [Tannerella sp.]
MSKVDLDLDLEANKEKRYRRTNVEIKKSIFDAILQIVKEKGFTNLSINLISEYSGINPLTINKRFKDIDDVIEQFLRRYDYWMEIFSDSKDDATKESYQETLEFVLDVVWKKKAIQQILAWQITEESAFSDSMAKDLGDAVNSLTDRYTERFRESPYDIRLVTAILLAAVFYISAYKKKVSFCGIDLMGHMGNYKLLEGINQISDLVFEKVDKTKEKKVAGKLLKYGDSIEKVMDVSGLSKEEIENL